ncbi:flagellar hook-length control protein FliK [Rhizobium sp. ARZ01]|uniref:flagellar hook-length control protein FliK n=1 Tax=Rhizobium sp. ARZ01 TaxID=2769313 RepID=UPI00177B701D|nr:flagellar hook-length control protein FliK [Rhizobium sp. ARZ01]MBD9373850.1 flagellar hook-length control protein FliK [Rhizobium sp. ARZ01]
MTTIDTNVLSQLQPKSSGKDKPQTEGDGKGQGKFAEAFANASAKGTASGAVDHQPIANRALSAEAATAEGGIETDSFRSIRHKQATSHRSGGIPAMVDAAKSLEDAIEAAADDGRVQPMDNPRVQEDRSVRRSHEAGNSNLDEAVDAERSGQAGDAGAVGTAGYDGLLSMLNGAALSGTEQSDAAASSSTLSAAMAALSQISHGGKTAAGGRSEDAARRNVDQADRGRAAAATLGNMAAEDAAAADALSKDISDADQIFRLVRADGRAKPVEIAISGNGEASAVKDQLGTKFEAVTVVDSRRYLGLAQAGNSSAVTAAIAQDPSWAAALTEAADKAPDMTGKVVNTLKIQLHPIDLGMVTATLRLQGEALVVDLKVETGKAYRNLSDDQDAIVKALRGHGFSVDQISVQFTSSSDRSTGAGQGDAQAQFSGQQQAREGGGGRQSNGEPTYAGFMDPNEGSAHEYGQAENHAVAGQRRGAGGVYL